MIYKLFATKSAADAWLADMKAQGYLGYVLVYETECEARAWGM